MIEDFSLEFTYLHGIDKVILAFAETCPSQSKV
jgi:hypothetical protein